MLPVNRSESRAERCELADRVLDRVAANTKRTWCRRSRASGKAKSRICARICAAGCNTSPSNDANGSRCTSSSRSAWRAIENRDPASTAEEADLAECGVRLRGSIDLVERHIARGVLRVTDHKTGKASREPALLVGGGRFLQPLLYALAAEKLLGSDRGIRAIVLRDAAGRLSADRHSADRSRRGSFWRSCWPNIDGAIAEGFLPPVPQKDACEICDYRIVCGPYEELRARAYKDRRDERLEPTDRDPRDGMNPAASARLRRIRRAGASANRSTRA